MLVYSLVVGVVLGYIAQTWKGRTGAFWGIAAFLLSLVIYFFAYFSATDIVLANPGSGMIAVYLTASLVTFVLMALIIATLPNKKKE